LPRAILALIRFAIWPAFHHLPARRFNHRTQRPQTGRRRRFAQEQIFHRNEMSLRAPHLGIRMASAAAALPAKSSPPHGDDRELIRKYSLHLRAGKRKPLRPICEKKTAQLSVHGASSLHSGYNRIFKVEKRRCPHERGPEACRRARELVPANK